jgi:hypothetical protein
MIGREYQLTAGPGQKRASAATEGGPQFTRSEKRLEGRIILRK